MPEPGDESADGADGADDEPERDRPSRRTLALIVFPILVVRVIGNLGNAFHPTLLNEHPMWLVAMEPRNRYLLLVAEKGVDFVPFILLATIRRLSSDPFYYLLGALYGKAGIRWVEHRLGDSGTIIKPIEKGFAKAGPVFVFLLPGAIVCALAGATGMSLPVFIALNVLGTVSMVTAMYYGADLISGPLSAINGFYGDYGKWLTIASVVITAFFFLGQSRKRDTFQSLDEIERELEQGAAAEKSPPPVDPS